MIISEYEDTMSGNRVWSRGRVSGIKDLLLVYLFCTIWIFPYVFITLSIKKISELAQVKKKMLTNIK